MKTLKATLFLTYAVLIALLLLSNLKSCKSDSPSRAEFDPVRTEVPPDEELIEEAIGSGESGDLKVTLLWDFVADIDLHVIQPNGSEINYTTAYDPSTGGQLDVDNKVGGHRSAENIYWEHPPHGRYEVYLHYYGNGSRDNDEAPIAGICRVVVFIKGQEPRTFEVRMSALKEHKTVVKFTI